MFTKAVRPLGLIALCLGLGCGARVNAAALTYDFSGTLYESYKGSTQLTGSFTYDTDLPLYPGITQTPDTAYYSGVPVDPSEPVVSLTFNLGNTPSSSFGTVQSDELIVTHTSGGDGFNISESLGGNGLRTVYVEIGMASNNLVARGPFGSTSPPTSLNLASFNLAANLTVRAFNTDGPAFEVDGQITSLTPVGAQAPVPEPTSLMVFAGLGAAFIARVRMKRRGRDR